MAIGDSVKPDDTIDLLGLSCPMPQLKMKKKLKGMKPGQILLGIGSDPGTKNDLPVMCKKDGHEYLGVDDSSDGSFLFYVKKGG